MDLPPFRNFHHFDKNILHCWITRKEDAGNFDDSSLQIICDPPPKVYENNVFAKTLNQYEINLIC